MSCPICGHEHGGISSHCSQADYDAIDEADREATAKEFGDPEEDDGGDGVDDEADRLAIGFAMLDGDPDYGD